MGSRPAFSQSGLKPLNRAEVDSDGVWLHTPKDEAFLDTLKSWFRWDQRYWSPERTAWRVVGAENIPNAIGLFLNFFPEGTISYE